MYNSSHKIILIRWRYLPKYLLTSFFGSILWSKFLLFTWHTIINISECGITGFGFCCYFVFDDYSINSISVLSWWEERTSSIDILVYTSFFLNISKLRRRLIVPFIYTLDKELSCRMLVGHVSPSAQAIWTWFSL